jgi:NAD(P) transhydrogenase subunit alpha
MTRSDLMNAFKDLTETVQDVSRDMDALGQGLQVALNEGSTAANNGSPFMMLFTVFVLAIFVGYYVVWKVTPALHSPLMAITNAISSVVILGGILACGSGELSLSSYLGFGAVLLAAVNIVGGFVVTQRMLEMFRKK